MTWIYLQLVPKEKLVWARSELKYEKSKGIHTYHPCKCERDKCRMNKCVKCWEEEIVRLEGEKK